MEVPTPAMYAEYLDSCLDDLFGAKGELEVEVPAKVCVAVTSLLQYLIEDLPDGLPGELHGPAIKTANVFGDRTPRLD